MNVDVIYVDIMTDCLLCVEGHRVRLLIQHSITLPSVYKCVLVDIVCIQQIQCNLTLLVIC